MHDMTQITPYNQARRGSVQVFHCHRDGRNQQGHIVFHEWKDALYYTDR